MDVSASIMAFGEGSIGWDGILLSGESEIVLLNRDADYLAALTVLARTNGEEALWILTADLNNL